MKNLFVLFVIINFCGTTVMFAKGHSGGSTVRVRSHVTKSGNYVPSHYRTKADSSKYNNWSTKGNVNPYTGKKGTKNP